MKLAEKTWILVDLSSHFPNVCGFFPDVCRCFFCSVCRALLCLLSWGALFKKLLDQKVAKCHMACFSWIHKVSENHLLKYKDSFLNLCACRRGAWEGMIQSPFFQPFYRCTTELCWYGIPAAAILPHTIFLTSFLHSSMKILEIYCLCLQWLWICNLKVGFTNTKNLMLLLFTMVTIVLLYIFNTLLDFS